MQLNVKEIADKADLIINGYAFIKEGEYVHASDRKLTEKSEKPLAGRW